MSTLRNLIKYGTLTIAAFSVCVAHADIIEWNGFGSIYFAEAMNPNILPYGLVDTSPDFSRESRFGLNLGAKLAEKWSVSAQLVANGQNDLDNVNVWRPFFKWAYLTYTPANPVSIKAGRQIFPLLIASEYVDVGYLLPYRKIPELVYAISPFGSFDGLSAAYRFDVGPGKLKVNFFGGRPNLDYNSVSTLTTNIRNFVGSELTYDGDGFRLHAAFSRQTTTLAGTLTLVPYGTVTLNNTASTLTATAGYRFDKSNFVSWAEYGYSGASDGGYTSTGTKYLGPTRGGYVLGGYRLGAFLPRYMFEWGSSNSGFFNGAAWVHDIGLNYQVISQAIVKLDFEIQGIPNYPETAAYQIVRQGTSTDVTATAVFAGVDFIF